MAGTALLVIDVQNDVVAAAHERDAVVGTISSLVERARAAATPVIWVQHSDDDLPEGTPGWEIVPELQPTDGEPVVAKNRRSSFDGTELDQILTDAGVDRLIVTGAQTDYCVRWTLHAALDRRFKTVLVADGHTTDAESPAGMPTGAELIAHTNATWSTQAQPFETSVVPAAQVTF